MSTITAWRTDEPCPVCATSLILHDDGTSPALAPSAACAAGAIPGPATTRTEVSSDRGDQPDRPRAQRMAMPLAREVVKDLAVEHGACIRPIQLRRTNIDTGEMDTVLVPCGHTLAHVCPSCAERARTLRAAQCREGWHLEDEPAIEPDPATGDQKWWVEKRAEAQQLRDRTAAAGQDTTDLDELLTQLDEEITNAGMRGKAEPRPSLRGGTARPGAARMPRTFLGAKSARGRWARPTPRRTARPSAPRCSSR